MNNKRKKTDSYLTPMQFTDPLFLFYFLPFALALLWLCTRNSVGTPFPTSARVCLFALTLIFYGFNQPWILIPFLLTLSLDFLWSFLLVKTETPWLRKIVLLISVCQNLGLLALFKYWDFLIRLVGRVSPELASHMPILLQDGWTLGLPAGISFYTFESLSFVIDIYRREILPPKSPLQFFSFMAMFPRFIAGPIVRYKDISSQLNRFEGMQLSSGLFLFVQGLFYKCCFADNFAHFTRYAFDRATTPEFGAAWIGVIAYTMQIYFDFSGYSLMAMGLGRCLGFRFPVNFNRPYLATSLQDFWQRWHISLSRWLRDYLYIPLGGNRFGSLVLYRNLLITMVLGGLWHGARGTFILWGAWHGGWLVLEKAFKLKLNRTGCLFVVIVGWVFFRCQSLSESLRILSAMVNFQSAFQAINTEALSVHRISVFFCFLGIVYCFFGERDASSSLPAKFDLSWRQSVAALVSLAVSLLTLLSTDSIPFLYFQF